MTGEIARRMHTDRLGLADLPELSDLLLRAETFRLRVAGWSMSPALHTGDQITVEPVSPTDLKVGDLIVFHHPFPQGSRLVCHRLIALEDAGPKTRLITNGDAVTSCGETIRPDQVLGRVVAIRRSGGWWRAVPALDILAMRIGRGRERLTDWLAQGVEWLQGLRLYRRIMRALVSRCLASDVGIPEGRRWFRYHRIGGRGIPELLKSTQRFHLVAKLAGICVGSLRVTASGEGYWIDHLYIRIRFRGLGVASQLLALAATGAGVSGARVLLASVEPANTAALHLFTKMGFRKMDALGGNGVSPRRDLPGPTFAVLERAL